jgi:hypothetical protein
MTARRNAPPRDRARGELDGGGGGGRVGTSSAVTLSKLGEKPDLDATIEAANLLAIALRSHQRDRPARLPSTLSSEQRLELRTFVVETLADTAHADVSDDVWQAIAPDVVTGGPSLAPIGAVETLLANLDESLDAVMFFDRLRG